MSSSYDFQYLRTPAGTKRRCETGTVAVRVTDDIDTLVHIDVLYDASGLYRGMVDSGLDPEAPFDVRASGLDPWQVDYFLCMAYRTAWTWPRDVTNRLEASVAAPGFFDASKDVFRAADASLKKNLPKVISPANHLEVLLAMDPVRARMPKTYMACLRRTQAMILSDDGGTDRVAPAFDVLCTRREEMTRLSPGTLVDLLALHRPLRDNSAHFVEPSTAGLTREEIMARRKGMAAKASRNVKRWDPFCETVDVVPEFSLWNINEVVDRYYIVEHTCRRDEFGRWTLVMLPATVQEYPLFDTMIRGTLKATIDGTVYTCEVPEWAHTVRLGWNVAQDPRELVHFEGSIRIAHGPSYHIHHF